MEERQAEVSHGDSHLCVAVRCRPPVALSAGGEAEQGGNSPVRSSNSMVLDCSVHFPGNSRLVLRHKGEDHTHAFDHVFEPTATQELVFQTLGAPQLDKALEGFNTTIFAYGQTGSGKTYTMMNLRSKPEECGLVPRMSHGLFDRLAVLRREHETRRFLVQCSLLEIYNEVIFDLFAPRQKQPRRGGLEVREQKGIGIYVHGLTETVVDDAERLLDMISEGLENRAVAATDMNQVSSRSHCVLIIKLHQKDTGDSSKNTVSKLSLVDLAGSERLKTSDVEGVRLSEGANINKSLSALGNVINALSSMAGNRKRKAFVPYRDSKLTRVLQESFGGNSLCTMIATLHPASSMVDETLATLNYARRAKAIRVAATRNEESVQIKRLQEEVEALRKASLEASEIATGPKEQDELVSRHQLQIEWLQSVMKQSWEDKQQLSKQYEEDRERAKQEAQGAVQQLRKEQRRRLQLLEQHGEIRLTLQALDELGSILCAGWPERILATLKLEQQLRSQLRAVKLFRESAGTDFAALWASLDGDAAAARMLLGQVHGKLVSLSRELEALGALDAQLEEELGLLAPEVALALHTARREVAASVASAAPTEAAEEMVDLITLVQRQLAEQHAKAHAAMHEEVLQLKLSDELSELLNRMGEDTSFSEPESKAFLTELQRFCTAMPQHTPRMGSKSAGESSRPVQEELPGLLGLSTLDLPDRCLSASSNTSGARSARLLQTLAQGGWCPRRDDASEFLEIDLSTLEARRAVSALSLQGRLPCTGQWQQTRELLKGVLSHSEVAVFNAPDSNFVRPPVRFVYDVAMALLQKHGCLNDWNIPPAFLVFSDMSREQKSEFFEELIQRTRSATTHDRLEAGLEIRLAPQEILSGKNCEETNRLLQALAYLSMGASNGLASFCPQWTTAWKLEYLNHFGKWQWCGAAFSDNADEALLFEGNSDESSVKFVRFPEPIVASKLRIHPVRWHKHAALRCEVHTVSVESRRRIQEERAGHGPPRTGARLKASVDILARGLSELQAGLETKEQARQRRKTLLREQAEQERGQLEQRLRDALARAEELEARAVAAETSLLQARAENERLTASLEQLEAQLVSYADARANGEHRWLNQENADLKSSNEELREQLLVVIDERDLARAHEEELFEAISAKDEELMQANTAYVDLTQRLQEKEVADEATDLLTGEMGTLTAELHEVSAAHATSLERVRALEEEAARLTEENQTLVADKDKLLRKLEKLKGKHQALGELLDQSEQKRLQAKERCEKMLERQKTVTEFRRSSTCSTPTGSTAMAWPTAESGEESLTGRTAASSKDLNVSPAFGMGSPAISSSASTPVLSGGGHGLSLSSTSPGMASPEGVEDESVPGLSARSGGGASTSAWESASTHSAASKSKMLERGASQSGLQPSRRSSRNSVGEGANPERDRERRHRHRHSHKEATSES